MPSARESDRVPTILDPSRIISTNDRYYENQMGSWDGGVCRGKTE